MSAQGCASSSSIGQFEAACVRHRSAAMNMLPIGSPCGIPAQRQRDRRRTHRVSQRRVRRRSRTCGALSSSRVHRSGPAHQYAAVSEDSTGVNQTSYSAHERGDGVTDRRVNTLLSRSARRLSSGSDAKCSAR